MQSILALLLSPRLSPSFMWLWRQYESHHCVFNRICSMTIDSSYLRCQQQTAQCVQVLCRVRGVHMIYRFLSRTLPQVRTSLSRYRIVSS